MKLIPEAKWPNLHGPMLRPLWVKRDADFLVMAYPVPGIECGATLRLTVVRAAGVSMDGRGRVVYRDGITWDDLMQVKRDVGFANEWAVEVFPPDRDVVNVANMRHLWILPQAPAFAWRKGDL